MTLPGPVNMLFHLKLGLARRPVDISRIYQHWLLYTKDVIAIKLLVLTSPYHKLPFHPPITDSIFIIV